ncbi:MAG TPA: 2TM domain-containing protein [Flavobacterium sp.]|jgi:hypothetical protein
MQNTNLSEKELYEFSKNKVAKIRSFYLNLVGFLIVIPALIFANLYYTPGFYWFIFSAFGWGIGITFHALAAFGKTRFLSPEWEAQKIQELMQKDNFK